MITRRAAAAAAALTLVTALSACGGDDGEDSAQAAEGGEPAAGSSEGPMQPGTGADAYKPDDSYVNAQCPDKEPPKTITMSSLTFCAKSYTAKAGETWTEVNKDSILHNVATDNDVKNPAKFKAPDLDKPGKATFKMPAKPGKYTIICDYHPGSMTAKLTITK